MNFRRMAIALTVGFLFSGTCTYLLSRKLTTAHGAEHIPELKYVAPSRPLKGGEILKPDNLELVSWPASTPIADVFTKPEAVLGRAVLYPIAKGQPITEQLLSAAGSGAGLAGKIPDGMRAIALRSDEVVGVAGFLLPDSHVDVLATVHTDKNPEPTTFIVLQNAQVLAAGHQIQPDPEGKPATVTVVTLLLSPRDAERAVLASLQGTIHFILRSSSDKGTPQDTPIDLAQLVNGSEAHPSPKAVRPARMAAELSNMHQAPIELVVDTIAGDKLTSDTFKVNHR
jgi:pilus assembly protein CpaB